MTSTLLVGGERRASANYLAIGAIDAGAEGARQFDEVVLGERLEDLGDSWPMLRALRRLLTPTGVLTLRFDPRKLGPEIVDALVQGAGYSAIAASQKHGERMLRARASPIEAPSLSCSVVVPCRNEVDNVDDVVRLMPEMGTHTELIFVDGASTDGTQQRIRELIRANPDRDIKLLAQTGGGGKAAAVRMGFDFASGDVLLILDADMTVVPGDLPRFFLPLTEGVADFANGNRLAYPMEVGAMPAANQQGNRAFARLFSWLLGTRVGDTLCGTKAIFRRDWPAMSAARPLFGGHDLWGDFDLLFAAAHLRLRILDVPVVYRARRAGESKMHVFRHGFSMARSSLSGFRALKLGRPG